MRSRWLLLVGTVLLLAGAGIAGAVAAEPAAGGTTGSDVVEATGMSWRRIAVTASGLIYWGGVLLQARRVRKKIGRTPNLRPKGTKERALWLGWMVVVVGWIAQPFFVEEGSFSPVAGHPAAGIAGLVLIVLGYLATLWCYAAMGAAWRIGIDAGGTNSLVQTGPYRRMRHPIYSFQMLMLAGAALLLPTPLSVAILLLHFALASVKAADEEAHLTRIFGGEYRNYMTRSGRFFPSASRG